MSEDVRTLQENFTIAVLRRPTVGSTVKGTGINERHFPRDLRPAFQIAMTKSQDEIRRLVLAKDSRIWPLYATRIVEWNEGQARTAARQLVHSIGRSADDGPINAVDPDDSSVSALKVKQAAARQLGVGRIEDYDPVSTGSPDDHSLPAPEPKPAALYETSEKQVLFEKTLVAIRSIVGGLEEIRAPLGKPQCGPVRSSPWHRRRKRIWRRTR